MATRRKIGLVELWVDLPPTPSTSLSSLLADAIVADLGRPDRVRALLDDEKVADLDLAVFPGWTLPGTELPDWALAASERRVIVLELLEPTVEGFAGKASKVSVDDEPEEEPSPPLFPWTTYILYGGYCVVEARQRFAAAAQASPELCADLVDLLDKEGVTGRAFSDPNLGRAGLMVCGEVNVVSKRGRNCNLPSDFPALDLVLNPAHTPGRLQAMREKRQALSTGRVLVTTANTHSRWNRDGDTGPAAYIAAECYVDGERMPRGLIRDFEGGAIVVYDVGLAHR